MLLKFTKQGKFYGLKENQRSSLIMTRYSENFLKKRKSQSRSPRKIEDEHVEYILSEVDKNKSLSAKNWMLIKSESNIDVGRTRIVEILISNGYKYRSTKLRLKNEIQHRNLRLNWCERHKIETCFSALFFCDESTFCLDKPVGARWVKSKEKIYTYKNKRRRIGHWLKLAQEENYHCICMNKIWKPKIT